MKEEKSCKQIDRLLFLLQALFSCIVQHVSERIFVTRIDVFICFPLIRFPSKPLILELGEDLLQQIQLFLTSLSKTCNTLDRQKIWGKKYETVVKVEPKLGKHRNGKTTVKVKLKLGKHRNGKQQAHLQKSDSLGKQCKELR